MPFSRPSFLFSVQQWIQEFPDRGANPQAWGKDPLFCKIFAENFIQNYQTNSMYVTQMQMHMNIYLITCRSFSAKTSSNPLDVFVY